jgi:hypothetical protein
MSIAFLDFEASSLDAGSYPIEVGWAVPERHTSESYLILPHPDWTDWDLAAQGVHGISRQMLFTHGVAGPAVLAQLSCDLAGRTVYTDAPAEDAYWLARLFQACGQPPSFSLCDAMRLFSEMAAVTGDDLEVARREVGHQFPTRHRAGPDAAYLCALWYRLANGREALQGPAAGP